MQFSTRGSGPALINGLREAHPASAAVHNPTAIMPARKGRILNPILMLFALLLGTCQGTLINLLKFLSDRRLQENRGAAYLWLSVNARIPAYFAEICAACSLGTSASSRRFQRTRSR
jgi:hypothetical protein